jgi:ABC-type transport system substrate-binding protein
MKMRNYLIPILFILLSGCEDLQLNNPYAENEGKQSVLYQSFSERPKHLDPAVAYSENEYAFIAQIYEPLFQYHYLRRIHYIDPIHL